MTVHHSTGTDGRLNSDDLPRRSPRHVPDGLPALGSVLAGRYELISEIGRGGMGQVYAARDSLLGRDVALKVLTTSEDYDAARQECLREARVAARVSHPNIATVLDVGADRDAGVTFLVMELVHGPTLRDVRRASGRLAPTEAVELVAQVASALEASHARGIVHGDVTPRNVIVRPDGIAKLVDFGIARVADATHPIEANRRYGSVPYLAPEQVQGAPPDARSDVYALGAVLYELLVGEPPYTGRDVATVMAARLVADPPSPSGRNPAISPALERVVLRALARDPARRYANAGELRTALSHLLDAAASETQLLPAPVSASPRTTRDAVADRAGARLLKRPRVGRGALMLAGLAVLLGAVMLGVALWWGTLPGGGQPGSDWAVFARPTCEWSNVATPPGICFGERPAGFRVRVVERQGPRWLIWDPTTQGVAYVDADALKPE